MKGVVAAFAAIILALALLAYQSPRVQELFRSPRRPVKVDRPVPGFEEGKPPGTREAPSPKPSPKSVGKATGTTKPAPRKAAPPPAPPKPNVPNSEVSRVLAGIFAAQGLKGLSLSVTDEVIQVNGEVDSEERRKKVLATLEKARETRRIDATGLTVAGQ